MACYSVKDISGMLNVSEETVRRWIRSRKLLATKTCRKDGYCVSEDELREFFEKYPKYGATGQRKIADGVESVKNESVRKAYSGSDSIEGLSSNIDEFSRLLIHHRMTVSLLKEEIESEERQIMALQDMIARMNITNEKA